jgi:hypothetical protein
MPLPVLSVGDAQMGEAVERPLAQPGAVAIRPARAPGQVGVADDDVRIQVAAVRERDTGSAAATVLDARHLGLGAVALEHLEQGDRDAVHAARGYPMPFAFMEQDRGLSGCDHQAAAVPADFVLHQSCAARGSPGRRGHG